MIQRCNTIIIAELSNCDSYCTEFVMKSFTSAEKQSFYWRFFIIVLIKLNLGFQDMGNHIIQCTIKCYVYTSM